MSKKLNTPIIILTLFGLLFGAATVLLADSRHEAAYIEPGLGSSKDAFLSVIVTASDSKTAAKAVERVGGEVTSDLWLIDAVGAMLPANKVADLAAVQGIVSIVNNKFVGTADTSCDDNDDYEHGPCARRPGWVTDKLEIKSETQAPHKFSAPVVQLPNGKFVVVLESNYVAFADENANLEKLIELDYKKSLHAPVIGPDGSIYFMGEDPGDSTKQILFALNLDGSLRWNYSQKELVKGGIALSPDGQRVYASHIKAKIYVLDAANGEKLFEMKPDAEKPGLVASAPIVDSDGLVYLQSTGKEPDKSDRRGNLIAMDPAQSLVDDEHILWRFEAVEEDNLMTLDYRPIINNGRVYAFSDSDKMLFALDQNTGSLLFSTALPTGIAAQPVADQDKAVFIPMDHQIFAINPDGSLRFSLTIEADAFKPLFSADRNTLYVGEEHQLYALNTTDGSIRWTLLLDGKISGAPEVMPNNDIAFGTHDPHKLLVVTDQGKIISNINLADTYAQAMSLDNGQDQLLVKYGDKNLVTVGDMPPVWDGRLDAEPTDNKLEWRLSNPIAIDIGADVVHNSRMPDGAPITGDGVTIAVVDSGVFFSNKVKEVLGTKLDDLFIGQVDFTRAGICLDGGVQYDTYCFVDQNKSVDHYGHGSHVAGIIWSQIIDYATGVNMGVAPGANILSVRVLGETGTGSYEDVVEGVQYVVENKNQFNIRVMNLSLSAEATTPYFADPFNRAVEAAWEAGIVVIAAAGNTGPGANTLTVPGNDPYIVTIGALDNARTPGYWADDVIPTWSSSGPTHDGFIKPDILAPGRNIISFMYNNPSEPTNIAKLAQDHPDHSQSISLFRMNGTSMATGVASGVSALILQAHPELTPDQVKFRLIASGRQLTTEQGQLAYNLFEQGAGRIWAPTAVLDDFPAEGNANAGMDIQADLAHGWGYYNEQDQAVIDEAEIIHHYRGPVQKSRSGDGSTDLYYVINGNGSAVALGAADAESGEWLDAIELQARALSSPSGNLVWSGGNLVWSGGELFDSAGNLVWVGGELIILDGKLLDTTGNLVWSGGDLFDAAGNLVWSGGNLVWSGGNLVWSGGNLVWSGGQLFDATGNLVWSGGNLVWSGGALLDAAGNLVWSGSELFDAAGNLVWSGGNLVWSGGNLVWSGGNLVWSGGNLVWSGGNLVWSGGNLVWSGGKLFDAAGNLVWSGGNLVWSGGELFDAAGNLVWSGGELFDAAGNLVWSGGNLVWSGGNLIWSGGNLVWSGGELFDAAGNLVWSGGNMIWSGGKLLDAAGNLVWSGGELFNAAGNLVWSGGNLVWSGGNLVWSGGNLVWSGGKLLDAAGNLVWSGGNLVWSGGKLFDIAGNLVWSGSDLFDAAGNLVWSGGNLVWSGGNLVWSGGNLVWSGGNLVWSGGNLVWSGGNLVWSGFSPETANLSSTYWVNDDDSVEQPPLGIPVSVHIADLDSISLPNATKWRAATTVTIYDNNKNPVENVEVEGKWSFGREAECVTNIAGRCTIISNEYNATAIGILSFTILEVEHKVNENPLYYEMADNTDPDQDSDGETISIERPVPVSMFVTDLDGFNTTAANKWRTNITVTIMDDDKLPVQDAKVFGTWSYGGTANCITDEFGGCSLLSSLVDGYNVDAIGFTVNWVEHEEILIWSYQAAANGDADGDSDGTTLSIARPEPIAMFVTDLDQALNYNTTKWWTTVSISAKSAADTSVSDAVVRGAWSYDPGRTVTCTTDDIGVCSLTSGQMLGSQADITFTVENISHQAVLELTYTAANNSDPDGDSDGNAITINRPEVIPVYVADLDGQITTNANKWRTRTTILLLDETQAPIANAKVIGFWSYNPTSLVNCTTDVNGQCSLQSGEFVADQMAEISFTVDDLLLPAPITYAYQPDLNSDPDGDSDGTTLSIARPEPIAMFVTDLDQALNYNTTKWWTTVSISAKSAADTSVSDAVVRGAWSYDPGRTVTCTTDDIGVCSLTSGQMLGSQADITFTVENISHQAVLELTYTAANNSDPDGDSDGNAITINRPEVIPVYVADLDGQITTNANKWRTRTTILLLDETQAPIANAKVIGFWSYNPTSLVNCTTDVNGQCSLQSGEFVADQMAEISFTVDDLLLPAPITYAYQPDLNSDPDGNSDGTTLSMARPEPIAMFITDLDGTSFQTSESEWKATITLTLMDAGLNPVVDADVFILWGNGKDVDCTTDENGQCSFTSDKLKFNDYETITLTIENITHNQSLQWAYEPTSNIDPDGDSDGTVIVIAIP